MDTIQESVTSLKQAWEKLKLTEPSLRIRDAAAKLGTSEAELLATGIGENVIRLSDQFEEQMLEFPKLGRVMALTRSEGCVLEHKVPFKKLKCTRQVHTRSPLSLVRLSSAYFFCRLEVWFCGDDSHSERHHEESSVF